MGPPLNRPPQSRTSLLASPDLGEKRICPSCAARFYDLNKRPIVCPKCAVSFQPEALLRVRRPRAGAPAAVREEPVEEVVVAKAKARPKVKAEDDEDEEVEDAEEGAKKVADDDAEVEEEEEEIKEVALDDETAADPDLLQDEDSDEKADKPAADEDVEVEVEEEADDDEEEDDALIENVDEDADVSDIIDPGEIEKE